MLTFWFPIRARVEREQASFSEASCIDRCSKDESSAWCVGRRSFIRSPSTYCCCCETIYNFLMFVYFFFALCCARLPSPSSALWKLFFSLVEASEKIIYLGRSIYFVSPVQPFFNSDSLFSRQERVGTWREVATRTCRSRERHESLRIQLTWQEVLCVNNHQIEDGNRKFNREVCKVLWCEWVG